MGDVFQCISLLTVKRVCFPHWVGAGCLSVGGFLMRGVGVLMFGTLDSNLSKSCHSIFLTYIFLWSALEPLLSPQDPVFCAIERKFKVVQNGVWEVHKCPRVIEYKIKCNILQIKSNLKYVYDLIKKRIQYTIMNLYYPVGLIIAW